MAAVFVVPCVLVLVVQQGGVLGFWCSVFKRKQCALPDVPTEQPLGCDGGRPATSESASGTVVQVVDLPLHRGGGPGEGQKDPPAPHPYLTGLLPQLDPWRHIEQQNKHKEKKGKIKKLEIDGQYEGRSKRLDPASRADRPQAAPFGR